MSDIQAEIRTSADGLAHRGSGQNWLARLARAGMVAQGAMYVLVGGLAIELALGLGGKTTDQRGALHTLADEWYGLAALLALAVGFAGYAIWRFAVAVLGEKIESEDDVGVGNGHLGLDRHRSCSRSRRRVLLLLSARRARERRLESKRSEALELRKQAESKSQRAEHRASVANELAERAQAEQKEAEVAARRADEVDPDVDD